MTWPNTVSPNPYIPHIKGPDVTWFGEVPPRNPVLERRQKPKKLSEEMRNRIREGATVKQEITLDAVSKDGEWRFRVIQNYTIWFISNSHYTSEKEAIEDGTKLIKLLRDNQVKVTTFV